ncbi:uncharacterized protein Nmlp_1614 [Natronomonas moolapensis 8.8.11]|uniref:Uncharacterized protein n=1 Tax=Natronomonas moolapensis (strain DSM 18674 / CECT 7526 / JCM 14361 / 8.8.11) TaxID=268739 RepID=M1XPA2_NATM8|nr:uncharacterized protein Nmlp_1614 [Natronomonas moolapensis 8.8.11]
MDSKVNEPPTDNKLNHATDHSKMTGVDIDAVDIRMSKRKLNLAKTLHAEIV